MKPAACLLAMLCLGAVAACAVHIRVKDAQTAIDIAKKICGKKVDPSLKWEGNLDITGQAWDASTRPSIQKSGDPLWTVNVPADGSRPSVCAQSLYALFTYDPTAPEIRPPIIPAVLEKCIRNNAADAAKKYRSVFDASAYLMRTSCNGMKLGLIGYDPSMPYIAEAQSLAINLVREAKPSIEIVVQEDGKILLDSHVVIGIRALQRQLTERVRSNPLSIIRVKWTGTENGLGQVSAVQVNAFRRVEQVVEEKLGFEINFGSDTFNPATGERSEIGVFTAPSIE